jgi:2-polyprenyl-3-methyl-5-hydroxy-6-metoxy-1,4-benzoquinol methylase
MEYVSCKLCGADNTKLLFTANQRDWGIGEFFNVVRCNKCKLVYINPRPSKEELSKYYPEQYYAFEDEEPGAYVRRKKAGEDILRFVRYPTQPKTGGLRILDVGSGKGLFLSVMKELGFESFGVELSPMAVHFSSKNYGVNVFHGELEQANFSDEYFDLVTMWQVLEHLLNPFRSLQEIFRILKKNGLLIIAVPNFSSFQAQIFQDKWYPLDVPRHLYQFEPGTLKKMLSIAGFKMIKIEHFNHFINFVGLKKSILNLLLRAEHPGGKKFTSQVIDMQKKDLRRQVLRALLDGTSFLFSELENILGFGGTIKVYARKEEY